MFPVIYGPSATKNDTSCSLVCSSDVLDQSTMNTSLNPFSIFFWQLFKPMRLSPTQPLHKLSIILPHESALIHALKKSNNHEERKTQTDTIGELFIEQAVTHSQKIAVELDEQSLSYNELLYYVQKCGIHLLSKHDVKSGEIICQCIERSLSMVSSSFNIIGKEYICCIV
jgi:non-ribosomal peptide synthetase component F